MPRERPSRRETILEAIEREQTLLSRLGKEQDAAFDNFSDCPCEDCVEYTIAVSTDGTGHKTEAREKSPRRKLPRYFTEAQDGLRQSWSGERCWLNPPYGHGMERWLEKAFTETRWRCPLVVALLPVRTEAKWWHTWVAGAADEIRFLKGRLQFLRPEGEKWGAPFASAVIIYRGGKDYA